MLALRKRLSYTQAKWALVILLVLSLAMSAFQIFLDWKEEQITIHNQVMSTLYIVESSAVEAAYYLDEELAKTVLTGLMRSTNFHKTRLEDDLGYELASMYRSLASFPLRWLSENIFRGLPPQFKLVLKRDNQLVVGTLIVSIDNAAVTNAFVHRNIRLIATSFISASLLGIAMFMLFYFQVSRPLSHVIAQLNVLENERDEPTQLKFKQSSREDELGILSRTITALWHKRKKVESELAKSEAYFKAVLHQSSECMLLTNLKGQIVDCNGQTCRLLEYDTPTLLTLTIQDIDPGQDPSLLKGWSNYSQDAPKIYEASYHKSNGESFPVEVCGNIITLDNETYFLASFRDITRRKKDQEQVRFLAYYDALTNLPNRRFLNQNLQQVIASTRDNGQIGGLLFIDLDRFKNINDSMGHHIGDALLVEAAKRIVSCLSESDTAVRIGGDEFVLLIPLLGSNLDEAQNKASFIAESLLSQLSHVFRLEQADLFISASIGVSLFPLGDADDVQIMRQADAAMYEAKESGRNAYRFYRQEMQQQITERALLEKALHSAISKDEFYLVYQPQVSEYGQLIGFEALIRWFNEELGLVPPNRFIPVAEEVGLIDEIGNWVLESVCHQLKEWQDLGLPPTFKGVGINISPYQFAKECFVETVYGVIERTQVDPSLLDLEITEGMLVENITSVAEKMWRLKEHNIRFSIDDFGTGYSSLRYLQHFPITQLKIDQSFVRDLTSDPQSHVIINTIVSMAAHMKLSVLAEGVEHQEEKEILNNIGCLKYQGYYFAKPVNVGMATHYLSSAITFPLQPQKA
ncbi:EAL domain-containing protein [Marinomonas rhizomae]|uniref:Diguanylate cyclase/phosphodiesterase n=1 Tax=Marinomonas rhizomae TaxID=491948 RepID=A0A366JFT5_9GAMM|nr:EAL domain-containing protein [Marinomonas rhizomae]RBP85279.1 diguanylate cyclase/phosphodiesterase [Marinomonas rhizomae]RNF76375.1 EAL domain-containing protein [Marinomonas rhizomae]